MGNAFLHLFVVGSCLYMSGINKNLSRINKFKFIALHQDMGKDLLKKIGILKAPCIVFPECRKMWHFIHHIQTEKPSVSNIYLDFFTCLPHAFNSIKILDKRNLDQHHGIHAGPTIVLGILVDYKVINEVPVNCLVYDSQKVILWNHVIHTKKLYLFSFFICILGHHK